MADGRLVIVAWFYDMLAGVSWGNLILGAEDEGGLESLVGRVGGCASL